MEVFLPFAPADSFSTQGGLLQNILSLWGPGLFPWGDLSGISMNLDWKWWDGRERACSGSVTAHTRPRPQSDGGGSACGAMALHRSLAAAHSGRGLVGVVLSSTPGAETAGVGDAARLWHKAACKLAQSKQTIGPPHLRDGGVWSNLASPFGPGDLVGLFNIFNLDNQGRICAGLFTGI